MSRGELIKALFFAYSTGSDADFRRAAEVLIQEEGKLGHTILAQDLRSLLQRRRTSQIKPTPLLPLGANNGRSLGDHISVLTESRPTVGFVDVILSEPARTQVIRVIDEHRKGEKLGLYSLEPKRRLLFYGPPGCGKTYTAAMIAHELGYPLQSVRVDGVISSLLGETAANLRRAFKEAENAPSVLLFDEFDSIGKSRDDIHEVGELKRVVNAFLQLLDSFEGRGLVIAATNHEHLLDDALWRRFEDVIYFDLPKPTAIAQYMRLLIRGVAKADIVPSDLVTKLDGLSYSDIRLIFVNAMKTMVLADRDILLHTDVASEVSFLRRSPRYTEKPPRGGRRGDDTPALRTTGSRKPPPTKA